ncbi:unnamed protein product, partial [Brenthis ino]
MLSCLLLAKDARPAPAASPPAPGRPGRPGRGAAHICSVCEHVRVGYVSRTATHKGALSPAPRGGRRSADDIETICF